ncbi:hypothetical protein TREVI0001_0446 [Treponema vincentii ATCC 35580]|uniref:Uncharacterized protein n=1 Tax=Treponema vincentii ATCC 35580 TaxID=596324 RepID=C8PQ77_9SPIR|nr:hypothetical protein TREVI0001_0446 [Treponema vincentii ATCC 35580]
MNNLFYFAEGHKNSLIRLLGYYTRNCKKMQRKTVQKRRENLVLLKL